MRPFTDDVRSCRVVGYTEGPGLERTSPVERAEASPELEMDLLPEVTAFVGVCLISGGKQVQHATTLSDRSRVEFVLLRRS
jgi:hypothetical protein